MYYFFTVIEALRMFNYVEILMKFEYVFMDVDGLVTNFHN